jgi:CheY-like chemotaxis protein
LKGDAGVDLNGKRILVVEDDFVLATAMKRDLEDLGATVLGPAPTPFYALQLMGLKEHRRLDVAILDIHLHRSNVFEVADALQERGIPFIFATGFGSETIPKRFAAQEILQKPVSRQALRSAVMKIVRKPTQSSHPRPPSLPPLLPATQPPALVFARALASRMGKGEPSLDLAERTPSSIVLTQNELG